MTLTGTFTLYELRTLSNEQAKSRIDEIVGNGKQADFEEWAEELGDWDELHDILAFMPEVLEELGFIEPDEEDEEEDEDND